MRRRLVLVALATTTMVAIAFVVPLGLLVRAFARDRALTAAETEARSVAPTLALTTDSSALSAALGATKAGAARRMGIWLPDGRGIGSLSPRDPALAAAEAGRALSVRTAGGARVLVPVVLREGTAVVTVEVPASDLKEGVAPSWAALAALAGALVVAAVAVADRLARGLVRPVEQLAAAATAIGAGNLATRTVPEGPPEVAEVAVAFNRMAERVSELLDAERELVADLSHRLRTPLTRLRLDAEALAGAPGAGEVAADVDALEAEVNRLILEARLPRTADGMADASQVVRDRTRYWSLLAAEEDRHWTVVDDGGPHSVGVRPDGLAAALDALIGNVFSHTPEGSAFTVSVRRRDGMVGVAVGDGGPGLSRSATARGVSGSGSTGLGLDIARRTAEAAGGRMEVGTSELGGAQVELLFPIAEVSSGQDS